LGGRLAVPDSGPVTADLEGLATDILEASGARNVVCVVEVEQ
jgi:hypothetical protein